MKLSNFLQPLVTPFSFQALSGYVLALMGQTRVHIRKESVPLMSVS
jgi:hypothetical protein